jgi:uncharacterized protein (TIGR00255 family)
MRVNSPTLLVWLSLLFTVSYRLVLQKYIRNPMIASMTGYIRKEVKGDWGYATWEIRSVNHRFLELALRLPIEYRPWEMSLREHAKKYLKRGKIDIHLQFQKTDMAMSEAQVNQVLLRQLVNNINYISSQMTEYVPPQVMDILQWPNLLQPDDTAFLQDKKAIFTSFDEALNDFVAVRQHEGNALQRFMMERLDVIRKELAHIQQAIPDLLALQHQKLQACFKHANIECDPGRLEQEMVLFAQKSDVSEEIERCQAHLQYFLAIVESDEELGRRLNFLLQEMAREVNTLSVKLSDIKITGYTVNLKLLIEQIREQVQNIE